METISNSWKLWIDKNFGFGGKRTQIFLHEICSFIDDRGNRVPYLASGNQNSVENCSPYT